MAEAIARHLLERGVGGGADVFVASAGVAAAPGMPPTAEAVEALRALGIEHRGRSKSLTAEMIRNADAVFVMTEGHARFARDLVGGSDDAGKITLLDPEGDIDDPIGTGRPAYDALARRLMAIIEKRLKERVTT